LKLIVTAAGRGGGHASDSLIIGGGQTAKRVQKGKGKVKRIFSSGHDRLALTKNQNVKKKKKIISRKKNSEIKGDDLKT